MPINIDCFEKLLHSHPNQPFVKLVFHGLCEGFWSWADSNIRECLDTLDLSYLKLENKDEAQFLCDQRDHEVFKGWFSEAFSNKLLPGMYCMPIFTIPKPHSTDFQIVLSKGFGNPRGTWVRVWRVGVRVWNV